MPWYLTPHGPHFVVEPGTIDEYERRDYVQMTQQQAADYFADNAIPDGPSFATESQVVPLVTAAVEVGAGSLPAALRAAFVAWAPKPNGGDDTAVLQALLDQAAATGGGTIRLQAGTYLTSAPLTVPDGTGIAGVGSKATKIQGSHAGAVLASATPGVRTYEWALRDFAVVGPGAATVGGVGIDLASVSSAALTNITVSAVETSIRVRSSINGGAVYNTFVNVKAQSCVTGFSVEASGSNSNKFFGCRANICSLYGLSIADSNANVWTGGQIEACGTGVYVTATNPGGADLNQVAFTRFENNATAWVTTTNVRYFQVVHPQAFGAYTFTDGGTITNLVGATGSQWSVWRSVRQDTAGSWLFERSANGGAETPAMVVRDSNTGAGTPVTHQAETERTTGYFYRGKRGGNTYWDVNALDGSTRMPLGGYHELTERAADPAAPAANSARLYLKDNGAGKTQLCVRFATGGVQVVATEP